MSLERSKIACNCSLMVASCKSTRLALKSPLRACAFATDAIWFIFPPILASWVNNFGSAVGIGFLTFSPSATVRIQVASSFPIFRFWSWSYSECDNLILIVRSRIFRLAVGLGFGLERSSLMSWLPFDFQTGGLGACPQSSEHDGDDKGLRGISPYGHSTPNKGRWVCSLFP